MTNIMRTLTTATICLCALVTGEPQVPSKSYLPPEEGYSYGAPSIPFPSPSPTPTSYYTVPTYKPPSPQPPLRPRPTPGYSTISPAYPSVPPTYPTYSTPKPFSTIRPAPQPTYGVPGYEQSGSAISAAGIPGAGTGGGEFDHLKQPHVPGMPFDFNYAVKDDYYGTDFAHQANSNGDQVRGEYRVLLPDGRLQIVKYVADWKDGYTAEVTYQGEAKYPQGPTGSGSAVGGAGYPGSAGYPSGAGYPGISKPPSYPAPKPTGGYGGSGYSGSGFSQPTAGYPSQPTAGYPSQPTAGYPSQPTAGYPSQPTAGYPSVSQPTAGYAGAQPTYSAQPISGYGGAQQSAGGYSAPDYGSY